MPMMLITSPPAAIDSISTPATGSGSLNRRKASMKITIEIAISVAPLASAARISAR